jgi:16S rRNA processing protein RimM
MRTSDLIIIGRISGLYGVKGWVKIFSHSEPREKILEYSPWLVQDREGWQVMEVEEGRRHGKGVVARLKDCTDRDEARNLIGKDIALTRDQLPELEAGNYYWSDLEGLKFISSQGVELGILDHLIETGGNDVMVVKGEKEILIPYIKGEVVTEVNLENGTLTVDWDPDY